MKKNILGLFIILVMTACQQATATPIDELAPYYGTPQPVKIILNGKSYNSEVGSSKWVYIDSNGNQYMSVGDAFAIITPAQPIVVKSPFSLTIELPILINPTQLTYSLIPVTDKDRTPDPSEQIARWNPSSYPEPTFPPLIYQQELTFSPTPGVYILDILAGWGGTYPHVTLRADYGFLIEVQE